MLTAKQVWIVFGCVAFALYVIFMIYAIPRAHDECEAQGGSYVIVGKGTPVCLGKD